MKDAFSRAFWLLVESLRVLDHEELPQVILISSEDELQNERKVKWERG